VYPCLSYMASLLQIASFLAERAGRQRDVVFRREMEDLIVLKRARFIANSLEKNPSKAKFYLQKFKVRLEKVDITDECEEEAAPACSDKAYKSIEKIPVPIQFGVHPFEYVGPIGGFQGFGWTTFGNEYWMKKRKHVGKKPRYAYTSERIYVFNTDLEEIQVEGIFDDPRLLRPFQACDGSKSCWNDEQVLFLEAQYAEVIIRDILANELRIALPNEPIKIKEDKNV
jgi:hypothetical protein